MPQDPVCVLTHHKCASTWLANYLDSYSNLNALRLFATHLSEPEIDAASDVVLLRNASYSHVRQRIAKGIHVVRNPMNIVVSAYHSHRNTHPVDGWPELAAQREVLRSVNEPEGMLLTIAYLERGDFFNGAVGPLYALRHWDFSDGRYTTVRMEDVVGRPELLSGGLVGNGTPLRKLPDDKDFTFEAITGRQTGQIDGTSHYRSGSAEQWRTELPEAAKAYLHSSLRPLFERFYPEGLTS